MAPPAKKMKCHHSSTSESGRPSGSDQESAILPIVFQARGLQPDLQLWVFETTFHVHSIFLKMHSEFFFKFLDSSDKKDPAPSNAEGFKYEWVTKVDEAGWALVDARSIEVS
jgi:hypothetical protein